MVHYYMLYIVGAHFDYVSLLVKTDCLTVYINADPEPPVLEPQMDAAAAAVVPPMDDAD